MLTELVPTMPSVSSTARIIDQLPAGISTEVETPIEPVVSWMALGADPVSSGEMAW